MAKRPEVAGQIRSKEYSEEFFIQTLKEKSQGVWMYLHYIIKEIESGARAPLDLANLPTGLVGYYAEYWDPWRTGKWGKGEEAWDELYAPLLTTLAAAQEAISIDWLIQWADVTAKPREVTRLLTEHWRAFITEKEVNGKKAYTPYHLSFKDFITGRVDTDILPPAQANLVKDLASQTVDAHKRIVNAYEKECNGEWGKLVEQDYPRLHLTAHLNGAEEYEKLRILLTEGDEKIEWVEAREKKEETYAGYLNDLTYVWNYAEQEQNYALAIRCMLIENSIHSLAANIPPELLVELAKSGVWSYAKCLSIIRQKTDEVDRGKSLIQLLSEIPNFFSQEIFSIAQDMENEFYRAEILSAYAPNFTDELKKQSISIAAMSKHKTAKLKLLTAFAPCLEKELKDQALSVALDIVKGIKDYTHVNNLLNLMPYLSSDVKTHLINEALSTTSNIKNEIERINSLLSLLQYFPQDQKVQIINDALSVARGIEYKSSRANALTKIAAYINGNLKMQVIEDAIIAACEVEDKIVRAKVLSRLSAYITNDLKIEAFYDAFSIKPTTADRLDQARNLAETLSALAPHLSEELNNIAFSAAYEIENSFFRSIALAILAPYLNKEKKDQAINDALVAAHEIDFYLYRANALLNLAQQLPENQKKEVLYDSLSAVHVIKDVFVRKQTLFSLAPYLHGEIRSQLLSAIKNLDINLFPNPKRLPPSLSINDKLRSQTGITNNQNEKNQVSTALTRPSRQDENISSQDISAIRENKSDYLRSLALINIARHLEDNKKSQTIKEVLTIAYQIEDEEARADVFLELANLLTGHEKDLVLFDALALTHKIKYLRTRAMLLLRVAKQLEEESRSKIILESLSIAREITDKHERTQVLLALSPFLGKKERIFSLQELLYTVDSPFNFKEIIDWWQEIEFEDMKPYLFPFIKFISRKNRKDGVEVIRSLTPALIHFRGPEIVPELYRAIQDTARWWP